MHLASPWRIRTYTTCLKNIVWTHVCHFRTRDSLIFSQKRCPVTPFCISPWFSFYLINEKKTLDNKVKPDLSTLRWWFCVPPNSFQITNSYCVFQNNEIPLKQVRLCFMGYTCSEGYPLKGPSWSIFDPGPPLKVRQNSPPQSVRFYVYNNELKIRKHWSNM